MPDRVSEHEMRDARSVEAEVGHDRCPAIRLVEERLPAVSAPIVQSAGWPQNPDDHRTVSALIGENRNKAAEEIALRIRSTVLGLTLQDRIMDAVLGFRLTVT